MQIHVLTFGLIMIAPMTSFACPSCYGNPDSAQTQGMNMAIIVMLGILALVFTGIGAFIYQLRKRILFTEHLESKALAKSIS